MLSIQFIASFIQYLTLDSNKFPVAHLYVWNAMTGEIERAHLDKHIDSHIRATEKSTLALLSSVYKTLSRASKKSILLYDGTLDKVYQKSPNYHITYRPSR